MAGPSSEGVAVGGAGEARVVELAEVLDLRAAGPLALQLLECRGADVTLRGAGVTRLGAQCLQVLLSAEASWAADGRVLTLAAASPELLGGLALLGVDAASRLMQAECVA